MAKLRNGGEYRNDTLTIKMASIILLQLYGKKPVLVQLLRDPSLWNRAIGRKNYLFCGNDDAAEDAAIIYTMMGCCKEAGADFRKWTNYFLEYIHEYDNDLSKPLDDFLPATLMERGLI